MAKFQKGHPGGPGRPVGSRNGSVVCKEWADKHGFKFLIDLAMGIEKIEREYVMPDGTVRKVKVLPSMNLRAEIAQYLIDRAYGKPTAMVDVDVHARLTLEQIITNTIDVEAKPLIEDKPLELDRPAD